MSLSFDENNNLSINTDGLLAVVAELTVFKRNQR